jgi:hypothetical protein
VVQPSEDGNIKLPRGIIGLLTQRLGGASTIEFADVPTM